MIIRSGLIENRKEIDAAHFRRHWREVHGPLAARLPNLRAYVQNLVTARRMDLRPSALHAVDGISQLWFEDISAMRTGMSSPENDACVADISGFLANVTLAVQQPGTWHGETEPAAKVMALHVGVEPTAVAAAFEDSLASARIQSCRWRVNAVLGNEFIVDPTVTRSNERITAVLEARFASADDAAATLGDGFWTADSAEAPAMVATVSEFVLIPPPAEA